MHEVFEASIVECVLFRERDGNRNAIASAIVDDQIEGEISRDLHILSEDFTII